MRVHLIKIVLFFMVWGLGISSKGQNITLKEVGFGGNYRARIYLPANYENVRLHYLVLYVLDGQVLFDVLVAIYRYNCDIYPPAIIVGIEQIERGKELIEAGETNPEGNEFFCRFLAGKLFPLIESTYRTNAIRVGIGHSHGGTFVLNAALKNDFFNAVVTISPTLWVNQSSFLRNYPPESPAWKKIKKLYCGYGDNDFPVIRKDVDSLFRKWDDKDRVKKTVFVDEDHNSAVLTGMRKGLEFVFEGFYLTETAWENIEESQNDSLFYEHFNRLSDFWGEKILPGEEDYNYLGYFYLEKEDWERAEQVFKQALYNYPSAANLYDSLGELYERRQQLKAARRCYRQALKIARKDKDMILMLPAYEAHLKGVKNKMSVKTK